MSPLPPVALLGAPRIGPRRELKTALESYWSGATTATDLLVTARDLRAANWARQAARGVTVLPSNDFSLYDQVLDTCVMTGAIPALYGHEGGPLPLDTYFAMARGSQGHAETCAHGCPGGHEGGHKGTGKPALEMTKWFDTNYHYMVPEFVPDQVFIADAAKPVGEFLEARALGHHTRPVLIGPVTFLKLGKSPITGFDPLSLIDRLLPAYIDVLRQLQAAGADWVQIDEPVLALDADPVIQAALGEAYETLARSVPGMKIMLASYFGGLDDNIDTALSLPVAGLHLDLVRAPEQLETVAARAAPDQVLSLGVIDGRNIWRADLERLLDRLEPIATARPGAIQLAASCSLLHIPYDAEAETLLDADIRPWLAFAAQKMDELAVLARALADGRDAVRTELDTSTAAVTARAASPRVNNPTVAARAAAVTTADTSRQSAFATRIALQAQRFRLPAFPTTTIGSFPQTAEVRKARSAHAKGELDDAGYDAYLRQETARAIAWQAEIGLDVLVHGEFERNDMVQYFAEQLDGFAFTRHGWVQSYGSRCVRPPVLYGDVSRPRPMTIGWWRYAQSLTEKPVKGMLTGPVTILNWSFVRDDLPRSAVCRQIALAIRDEVADLEAAGAGMIQIDEAALREGLPLKAAQARTYLDWAVECFRLCASGVTDTTQIHTHMCYSEFNLILPAIAAMDADVVSIETSRSKMELLDAFGSDGYPADIGPGVYDIHSPRVPETAEMTALLRLARQRLDDARLWVNPDCGLKTRRWEEVRPALVNMVAAAQILRAESRAG